MNLIPPYVIFAVIGVVFLLGVAGAVTLARFLRRKFQVAAAIVSAADVEHRRSRFEAELERHGLPASGHASRAVVELAAERAVLAAQVARADTQILAVPHVPHVAQHAAPERDDLVDQLRVGGWTRGELKANAGHHIPDQREGGR